MKSNYFDTVLKYIAPLLFVFGLLGKILNGSTGIQSGYFDAALVVGVFLFIIGLQKRIDAQFEDFNNKANLALPFIKSAPWAKEVSSIGDLIDTLARISKTNNRLLSHLAFTNVEQLNEFLKTSESRSMPFLHEEEILTVENHFSILMDLIRNDGNYFAVSYLEFWLHDDRQFMSDFIDRNHSAASNGGIIKRVIHVPSGMESDPEVIKLLRKHEEISRFKYKNGGSIETRVRILHRHGSTRHDFGVYWLDEFSNAVAIAKFNTKGELQGNEVSFHKETAKTHKEDFEGFWAVENGAIDISEFLGLYGCKDTYFVPKVLK